jgi:hypothetical protein
MLKDELEAVNNNPNSTSPIASLVHRCGPSVVVKEFRDQIYAYAKHEYPFNESVGNDNPLTWWEVLEGNRQAEVLAV